MAIVFGLFGIAARVFISTNSRFVPSYATVTTTIHQPEQPDFARVMADFAKVNGFEFKSEIFNDKKWKVTVFTFRTEDQDIYESNDRAPESFEASFFPRSKLLKDPSLPAHFVEAINARFGDRAVLN